MHAEQDDTTITQLFTAEQIAARIEKLADDIAATMPHDVTIVVVLKGAFVFAADLMRALNRRAITPRIEFVTLSSYGADKESSGVVRAVNPFPDLDGHNVLVVEDIVDTGRTLAFATAELRNSGAATVRVCTLLDKPARREVEFTPDYVGFAIEDLFVVGYGIDYADRYRQLAYVGTID